MSKPILTSQLESRDSTLCLESCISQNYSFKRIYLKSFSKEATVKRFLVFCSTLMFANASMKAASANEASTAAAAGAMEKFTTTVVNVNSSLCLAIGSASAVAGKAAIQWTCGSGGKSGNPEQKWQFNPKPDGFEIVNGSSGLCLAIAGGKPDNAVPAVQQPCNGGLEQRWLLPDENLNIINARTKKCLAIGSAKTDPGLGAIQWPCNSNPDGNPEQEWIVSRPVDTVGEVEATRDAEYDFRSFENDPLQACAPSAKCDGTVVTEDISTEEGKTRALRVYDNDSKSVSRVTFPQIPMPARTFDLDLLLKAESISTILVVHGTGLDGKSTSAWEFMIQPVGGESSDGRILFWDGAWHVLGIVKDLHNAARWSHVKIEASSTSASITAGDQKFTATGMVHPVSNITNLEIASTGTVPVGTNTYIDNLVISPEVLPPSENQDGGAADAEDKYEIMLDYSPTENGNLLTWNFIPGVNVYRVYRDDKLLGSVSALEYLDAEVSTVDAETYTVVGEALLPSASADNEENASSENWMSYTGSVDVKPGFSAQAIPNEGASKNVRTIFRYRTFIASRTAPGFPCVKIPTNTYFSADNRGYEPESGSNRTMMQVTAYWNTGRLATAKTVGSTKNYSSSGKLRGTKTGSSAKMLFKNLKINGSKASFQLDHTATNPWCANTGGAVRYKANVTLYKDGRVNVNGWRRPVPHHEAYVIKTGGKWKTVFKKGSQGLHCLTGICGNKPL